MVLVNVLLNICIVVDHIFMHTWLPEVVCYISAAWLFEFLYMLYFGELM